VQFVLGERGRVNTNLNVEHRSASLANQMMVRRYVGVVMPRPSFEVEFADLAKTSPFPQSAVNGCSADFGNNLDGQSVDFVGGQVNVSAFEHASHSAALGRKAIVAPLQSVKE